MKNATDSERVALLRLQKQAAISPLCAAVVESIRDGGGILETITTALLMVDSRQRAADDARTARLRLARAALSLLERAPDGRCHMCQADSDHMAGCAWIAAMEGSDE